MEKQKKIALINDLSCVGKCSLTCAIPIISACGFEAVPLPTGVFSAHTEFEGYVCTDLTDRMDSIVANWKQIGMRFDCIYTGYLASHEQAEKVKHFMIDFKKSDTLCIVDPVMGDNGKFYNRIDESFIDEMRFLCSLADIIVPNVTEAEMLTNNECMTPPYDIDYIKELLISLRELGTPMVVITGIENDNNEIGCAVYDSVAGTANMFFAPKADGRFPGSGDVFASALTAAVMSGKKLTQAVQIAMGFTGESVAKTVDMGTERKFGLCFEPQIINLIRAVK